MAEVRDSQPSLNVGEAIDQAAWSGFQKLILAYAALAFAMDGLANQVLGLAVPDLIQDWGAQREQFAIVFAMGLGGVTVGAAMGGMLGDRIGRRWGLIVSVLLFGSMTALSATANDITALAIFRALDGVGIGGAIPNGAALISESTPARRRSLAIALGMVFIPIGGLAGGLIATYVLPEFGWRTLFVLAGLLSVSVAVLFVVALPESPRFLVQSPQQHPELNKLLQRFRLTIPPGTCFTDNVSSGTGPADKSPLKALFAADIRGDTSALWVAFFFCLLSSYTLFSWSPTMLAGEGFDLRVTSLANSAFNFGGMAGGIIGGWLIQRKGSRLSLLGFASGGIAAALLLATLLLGPSPDTLHIIAALGLEGFFTAGLINAMYTLSAHVYPPVVRATGVGSAAAAGRIGAVLSSFTGIISLNLGGSLGFFAFIAVCLGVSLMAIVLIRRQVPPEA